MKVRELMTENVIACTAGTSMEQAARLMWEGDCGVLPVVEDGRVTGIVTDRDLCMGCYTRGRALRDLRVADSMSEEVFSCAPDDPIEQAIRTMADHQVHRVPVTDAQGGLVGIVSMNDLVRKIVSLGSSDQRAGLSRRVIEAMAVICEPRRKGEESLEARVVPQRVRKPAAV